MLRFLYEDDDDAIIYIIVDFMIIFVDAVRCRRCCFFLFNLYNRLCVCVCGCAV